MTGGTVAIIIAALIVLMIVALVALAIFLMIKFAYVIIPTCLIGSIVGKFGNRSKKRKK